MNDLENFNPAHRHDEQQHTVSMDLACHYRTPKLSITTGPLTDKKIEKYRKMGYYSAEYREARKEFMERKKMKAHMNRVARQQGNWSERDGRWIYCPI